MISAEDNKLITDIRKIRKSLSLTQAEVAEDLGVSRATYIAMETGARPFKNAELLTLASIFELPTKTFVHYDSVRQQNALNIDKYKQVLMRCVTFASLDRKIPKTKLAKLIYLVDFVYFYKHAEPITNAQYRRIPFGPVPDVFFSTIDELFEEQALSIEIKGRAQLVSAIEDYPSDSLSTEEIELINKICQKWSGRSTQQIVDFTHEQLPWKTCKDQEIIPYELIIQEDPENLY